VILCYLVSAFGKSEHDHLYPKDVTKRALVDLHLHFDLSTLYQRTLDYFFPTIILGAPLDEARKARLVEGLGFFESMLRNKKFSTGDDFTIADLSLCVTVSQIETFDFDLYPFPKVRKWLLECKKYLEPFGYQVKFKKLSNVALNLHFFSTPTGNQRDWR
jgi:glutathione S-transferase